MFEWLRGRGVKEVCDECRSFFNADKGRWRVTGDGVHMGTNYTFCSGPCAVSWASVNHYRITDKLYHDIVYKVKSITMDRDNNRKAAVMAARGKSRG